MEINFLRFVDNPMVSNCLSAYCRARGFAFGIMAGWLLPDNLDEMISAGMIADGTEVFQIACLVCNKALRRPFSKEEVESAYKDQGSLSGFEKICHDGFDSEVPCTHFDQYLQFTITLANNSDYAKGLDDQIKTYARLIEVGNEQV